MKFPMRTKYCKCVTIVNKTQIQIDNKCMEKLLYHGKKSIKL